MIDGRRLLVTACLLSAPAAMAANEAATRGGPGCCSLLFWIICLRVYRDGGVNWPLGIGATLFPGIFGWFVWRNRDHGNGARWFALVLASLQAFFFLLGVLAALLLPSVLKRMASAAGQDTSSFSRPVDLSQVPEDPSLGLHPPAMVSSDPPGATVFVDGEKRGVTPLETPLTAGAKNELRLELPGYFPVITTRSPNTRERLDLSFTLQPAAQLEVKTEPPGARVFVGRKEVLARTPGTTAVLDPGEVELLVVAEGHQPHHELRTVNKGVEPFDVTLEPGVEVNVTSRPLEGDVFLDGVWMGQTPMKLWVSSTGKHLLEVRRETWTTATKKLEKVKKPVQFAAVLIDADRVKAEQDAKRARAHYARVEAALNKVQAKMDRALSVPASLEQQRLVLERDMERAAEALDRAESRLRAVVEARGRGLPVPPVDEP